MTWNEFMERHDRWSGATLRSRIYALKEVGPNEEVIAAVFNMPEERYKAQLIRKAIKLGNVLTDEDLEKLKSTLAVSTFDELFADRADYDCEPTEVIEQDTAEISADVNDDNILDDVCFEPTKPRIRIFTKRNKVMDALAKLFGLPVPPEKRTVICGCPESCDECPKKKTGACK